MIYLSNIQTPQVLYEKSELRLNSEFASVEYSGLEPLTSTLPVSRSSQMS